MPKKKLYRINPDRETPWNDLPELPVNNNLYHNVEVLERLVEAKSALSRLQGRSIVIPDQGMLINTISLQESKDSSAVENVFTTDDDLYRAYSEENTDNAKGPAKEVLRYREALWSGYANMKNKQGFDLEYFINIYQEIKQAADQFRPEFIPTRIVKGGSGSDAGQVVYTPPRGKDVIESNLNNLIEYINNDDKYPVDPLIKMAIGHFQFEAIHPFRDGNGRVGRVFNIHLITQKKLLEYPILYLSKFIIDHKEDYYRGLSNVSQKGMWQEWIVFMLKAVEVTSNITYNKVNDIISVKDAILRAIVNETDIRRPEALVNLIFTQPFTKVRHLTQNKTYAENTARLYLQKLTEMGILEQKNIQGNHYYLNLELYRILGA